MQNRSCADDIKDGSQGKSGRNVPLSVLFDRPRPGIHPAEGTEHVLRVDVDLALISVTVSDPQGRFVTGLGPERFQIWEDKVEQKIEYFSQEDVPLSVGVIFDASGSMKEKTSKARDTASTFLAAGNREDEYFLVEFSTRPMVSVSETFTTNASRLQNHLIFTPARGLTALFDAVYLGLERIRAVSTLKRISPISFSTIARSGWRVFS